VQTITVTATRPSVIGLSEMELLLGSAVVIAVLAWMVLARVRRHKHQAQA
jgi:hypothetical protein